MKALIAIAALGIVAIMVGIVGATSSPTEISDIKTVSNKVVSKQVSPEQANEAELDTYIMIGAMAAATS